MKKLVMWAIVLIMVCFTMCGCVNSSNSYKTTDNIEKEDLVIHNGIKFGDTIDDIRNKETLKQSSNSDNQITYMGNIAGIDNSLIQYEIDDNGKLYRVIYRFPIDSYDKLYKMLIEKYGKDMSEEEYKEKYEYEYNNIGDMNNDKGLDDKLEELMGIIKENTHIWIYDGKEYNVVIEYTYRNYDGKYYFKNDICYTAYKELKDDL